MTAEFLERPLPDLLDEVVAGVDEPVLFVNPSQPMLCSLVEYGVENDSFPSMCLLAEEWTLKETVNEFRIASRAADLVADELLEIKYVDDPPKSSLLLDGSTMVAFVDGGEPYGALRTDARPFVATLFDSLWDDWNHAEDFALHTPPISRIERTLEERLGTDRREDFTAILSELEQSDGVVDEVVISLLVAAKNDDLLYDISKWGEDIGLASKATFSRKKTELEKAGIIDTDKEPIDVGRPRLRLKLADASLRGASADRLVDTVDAVLA